MSAALTFARRELRGGLRSFRVFLACLALGVGGLAAVGSVVAAIQAGIDAQARDILGGDLQVELTYRFATEDELAAFEAEGDVSLAIDARSMARVADDAAVVQLKAVDDAYPLYGAVVLEPAIPLDEALAIDADGRPGAVAEPALITRLGLEVGDVVLVGAAEFELRAALIDEPDRAVSGLAFGPRLMIGAEAVAATGLVQPGTLFETEYRIRAPEDADLDAAVARMLDGHADAGWRVDDRRDGAPGVERVVGRIGAFLTLVGLAALAVGGVGVGASVRAYLDGKRETIATLKTIGASGATIVWTYLAQVGVLAVLGVAAGLVLGAAAPLALAPLLAAQLPVPADFGVYPAPLFEAAVYGLSAALLFALWPLARAREIRAAGLFRDLVAPARATPRPAYLAAMVGLAALLTAAAVYFTGALWLSLGFMGGVAAALATLAVAASLVGAAARAIARSPMARGRLPLRLAMASVGGSSGAGGETRGAVLALGLGLTVLTTIGLIDVGLRRIVSEQLPERAPAYFVIDIQNASLEAFRAFTVDLEGVEALETAPMLRGVIAGINGMTTAEWIASGAVADDYDWVLRGDRGVSYAAEQPPTITLSGGAWWEAERSGAPLMSFGAEQAAGIGVGVGDEITVNVLGRDVTGRIAALHDVDFSDGGINFLMIFDAGVLAGAPHAHIATIYGEEPQPGAYLRAIAGAFPATTAIRVADVLQRAEQVLGDVAAAARAGAVSTLITGLVVLIGAAAAGQRRQIFDAAVLKTLGASRRSVLSAMTLRSALLGFAAAIVALLAGSAAAWAVMRFVMEAPFAFDPLTVAAILFGGVAATLAAGALFARGPLAARPARVLRARE